MSHNIIHTEKTFVFIRHGLTEMNERLQVMPWYSDNFVDGALWDTRLTPTGIQQAKEQHEQLAARINANLPINDVEVLLASPLTRTLHTAELVFFDRKNLLPEVPKVAHPLLRERLYLSSEVGRCSSELRQEYPDWDFSAVTPGQAWWYVHPESANRATSSGSNSVRSSSGSNSGSSCRHSSLILPSIHLQSAIKARQLSPGGFDPYAEWRPRGVYCCEGEPKPVFTQRVAQLREYLLSRPERCLAVVTHWGVLKALTGREFRNCEVQVVRAEELLTVPDVTDQ